MKCFRLVSRWLAVGLVCLCGFASAWAIKRRTPREARHHPEAVVIAAQHSQTHKTASCSGVLIAPSVVLTAAHCIDGFDTWDVVAPYVKTGKVRVQARAGRIYPAHKEGVPEGDVAVLLLHTPIELDGKYPSLHGGGLYPLETSAVVLGGVTMGTPTGDKVFEAAVTLVAFPDNVNVYGGSPPVAEPGDSGGPVYVADRPNEVAAIISGQIAASRGNVTTDLYVPLTARAKDWILQQLPKQK